MPLKTWKNNPQKLLIIGSDPFFITANRLKSSRNLNSCSIKKRWGFPSTLEFAQFSSRNQSMFIKKIIETQDISILQSYCRSEITEDSRKSLYARNHSIHFLVLCIAILRLSSLSATAVKTPWSTSIQPKLAPQKIHLNLQVSNNLCLYYRQAEIHLKVCLWHFPEFLFDFSISSISDENICPWLI